MPPCSFWAYIDAARDPAVVRVESTCSLYGVPVARLHGEWLAEPRGSKVRIEYTVPGSSVEAMRETPCTPFVLPQPWPPFAEVDAEVVVDTKPGVLLYGLPARRSTVVTLTERTLLEGRTILQVVSVGERHVIDEVSAVVDGWLQVATVPPLEARAEGLRLPRACGHGMHEWGHCLWEHGWGIDEEELLLGAPQHPWARRCIGARLYAGSLAAAGLDPAGWIRRVGDEAEGPAPVRLRGRVVAVDADAARVVLARGEGESTVYVERTLPRGLHVLERAWERVGLACRRCLRSLPGGEPS